MMVIKKPVLSIKQEINFGLKFLHNASDKKFATLTLVVVVVAVGSVTAAG